MHQRNNAESLTSASPMAPGWRHALYRQLSEENNVRLNISGVQDGLFPALCQLGTLAIHGNAGDYAFAYNDGPQVHLQGNAGFAAGFGVRSGIVHFTGNVGDMTGAYGSGGSVIVDGTAGNDCATALKGADVCVVGNAGHRAGFRMRGGSLVIQGNCGNELGFELTGGVIYITGEAGSVAKHIRETRMKEPDRFRLSLILARTNLGLNAKNFRVYKPDT